MAYRFPSPCPWDRDQRKVGEVTLPSVYHGTVNLLPNVPSPLAESSAAALEWPRLREHIAGFAASPLGRAWVLALEPCSDLVDRRPAAAHRRDPRLPHRRRHLRLPRPLRSHRSARPVPPRRRGARRPRRSTRCSPLSSASPPGAPCSRLEPGNDGARAIGAGPGSRPSPRRCSSTTSPRCCTRCAARSSPTARSPTTPAPNSAASAARWSASTAPSKRACANRSAALAAEGSTQEDLITVRGERFVIPVKAEFRRRVPGVIHGSSSSGQTVFVEPLETIEQNNELQPPARRRAARGPPHPGRADPSHRPAGGRDPARRTSILAEIESHFARARFAN
jgi:DNA mismatch repair protein MutS2